MKLRSVGYDFCHSVPKLELHCHLLGSIRKNTFMQLTQRANAAGRVATSKADVEAFYTRGDKPVGVLKALRALDSDLIRTPADLHQITHEYLCDAAAHNVRYAEFFWNPTGTAEKSGIPYPAAVDAISAAIADAERDCGIVGRLIVAIDREASPAAAQEMLGWVLADKRAASRESVIGLGMDYSEVNRPPELFAQTYLDAKAAGLKTTCHAGEFGMHWHNVRTAVQVLGCDRIDHGYTVVDEPQASAALLSECAEKGVVFTVVPTNSYYLRTLTNDRWAKDHPIRRMPGLGIRIHPNTDDPTLHHVTPSGVWQMMANDFGFGLSELRQFTQNGLDAAWIDDSTRRAWAAEHLAEFDVLAAQIEQI